MNVLLIEDNPGDIALFQEALNINNFDVNLSIIEDGEIALNSLDTSSKFVELNGIPDMIIIDINLPKVSGKEILAFMQSENKLAHTPKIILSTSNLKVDMDFCYKHGANCFLTKPNDVFEFFKLVKQILSFWWRD